MRADQLFDLTGNVVLITGAASGLGKSIAEVMLNNSATTVLSDVNAKQLDAVVNQFRTRDLPAHGAVVDVTDTQGLRRCVDGIVATHGRIDVLFANAGISAGPGPRTAIGSIENITDANWDRVIATNLTSVMRSIQAVAPHMKRQNYGRIIATASTAGFRGHFQVGYGYVATKSAVMNLVRHAAVELAPYNILVNAIAPGAFLTSFGQVDEKKLEAIKSSTLLGRLANVSEIHGLALLLASRASSFITGAVISVDGGQTAK